MKYKLIENEGVQSLTVIQDGEVYSANTNSHANFASIKDAVMLAASDESSVTVGIFDLQTAVTQNFQKVSDRFSVRDGIIYVDLDTPLHNALSDHVLRALEDGDDFTPLVAFYDNIEANPNEHSRTQLYNWLSAHDFTINAEGYILGYKGVSGDVDADVWHSISSGRAFVNGVEHNGHIPQTVGDVVEMPRTDVEHDPSRGCHVGLHVGTWDYASGFARGSVLEVIVNPRDVVSVPSDCGAQKMRTCRYVVGDAIDAPHTNAVQVDYDEEDDYEDYEGQYGIDDEETLDDTGEFDDLSATGDDIHAVVNPFTGNMFTSGNLNVFTPAQDVTAHVKSLVEEAVKPLQDEVEKLKRRPTADNHLNQKRGPGGKFLPKS